MKHPLSLSDGQLQRIMDAGALLPLEKRSLMLERLGAILALRGPVLTDDDVGAALEASLTGLIHEPKIATGIATGRMTIGGD
jgi:hypothetical protein